MAKVIDFFKRKKKEINVDLNDVQKKAVLQTEGPLLLLASPGSGKTTTIIMRIGYLIEVKGISPSSIKAVTFSKASAQDMKDRFKRFFPELPPVDFSTIHSFAFGVIREHFQKTGVNLQIIEGELDLDNENQTGANRLVLHKKSILRTIFKDITGEIMTDDQFDELSTYISYVKNKMIPAEKWPEVPCNVPEAAKILQEYEAFKRRERAKLLVDFDDMLTIANQILEKDRDLLQKYQQKYDYVLTDESQDTSLVQHAIIEKLVRKHLNLCVVADDDQSIYSWRGAEPSYLLQFKQVYPHAMILFMEQNYRSSKNIVSVANRFIKRNKNRYPKNMFTHNPEGKPILIKNLADYDDQASYLAKTIQQNENLREVAVLYRNNSSSISLMNEFDRMGIPFYIKDADNRFFSHWVVQDILNFMRMAYTDKRPDILERIHTKLNAYITKQQMAAVMEIRNNKSVFDNLINYVQLQGYQRKLLRECRDAFQQMKGMSPLEAIRVIRSRLGYDKAIEKMCERLGFQEDYLKGIINTLEHIAGPLETMESFAKRIKHLEEVLKRAKVNKDRNAVTLSTFHSAKGLEFEKVYMIDLIEGIIPSVYDISSDSKQQDLMEEAARLFYVGMTRAKLHLELITYSRKDDEKVHESRFVSSIRSILHPPRKEPESSLNKRDLRAKDSSKSYSIGSRTGSIERQPASRMRLPYNPNAIKEKSELGVGKVVKHRVFGHGQIEGMDEERIQIRFERGVRTLLIQTCLEMGLLELQHGE